MTPPLPVLPADYRLIAFETIGSTNDEAKRLARDGAPEGTLVWAREQTAGRGRRGRPWSSPRGNLYLSLVLRPSCALDQAAQLGFVAALAVIDAVGELVPGIAGLACKWPNDVLLDGRKFAGILLESEMGERDSPAFLILGVGVNLVSNPADARYPATSITGEGHATPAAEAALAAVARHFASWSQRWRETGFAPVRTAWLARAAALGEPVRVALETGILHGTFIDIDQHGALLLDAAGERRRISAGDVFPAR